MKKDYPVEVLCEAFCVSRSGSAAKKLSLFASSDNVNCASIRLALQKPRGAGSFRPVIRRDLRCFCSTF